MSASYDPERLRARLTQIELPRVYRIIRARHKDTPLKAVPTPSRFSDPEARYSVLYASDTVRCSFWEALVRNRFDRKKRRELPRADIDNRVVAEIRSKEPLSFLDLRGDGAIRISAPTAVAHDGNHAAGRSLSAALYNGVPEADGIVFLSRFTGNICVALFDRASEKLAMDRVNPLGRYTDLLDALDDYGITLTRP